MRRHKPALDGQREQGDREYVNIPRQVRTSDWMQKLPTGSRRGTLVEASSWMFQGRVERTVGL